MESAPQRRTRYIKERATSPQTSGVASPLTAAASSACVSLLSSPVRIPYFFSVLATMAARRAVAAKSLLRNDKTSWLCRLVSQSSGKAGGSAKVDEREHRQRPEECRGGSSRTTTTADYRKRSVIL